MLHGLGSKFGLGGDFLDGAEDVGHRGRSGFLLVDDDRFVSHHRGRFHFGSGRGFLLGIVLGKLNDLGGFGDDNIFLETGGDEGHLEFVVEGFVGASAPDDIGGAVGLVEDIVVDLAELFHGDFVLGGVGVIDQDVLGAMDVVVVEEDAGGSCLDGVVSTVLALAGAGTHEGGAAVLHDGVDILEVDVDIGVDGDDFGNTLGGSKQDVVGHAESLREFEVAEGEEFVVIDDKDGVDMLAELHDAGFGLLAAAASLGAERKGDDGDHEDFLGVVVFEVDALGDLGDDGSCAGAGAAAHTGGNKEHLGVMSYGIADFIGLVQGGLTGTLGLVAGSEAEVAQRNLVGHGRGIEGLHVGVADDEVNALDALAEHVVHGVAAATADTDDFDVGRLAFGRVESENCVFFHVLVYFYLIE